jgi:hypothetical protein
MLNPNGAARHQLIATPVIAPLLVVAVFTDIDDGAQGIRIPACLRAARALVKTTPTARFAVNRPRDCPSQQASIAIQSNLQKSQCARVSFA